MDIYYTKEHEWIMIDGTIGTIGITNYAISQLGDITYVELPAVGDEITQADIFCSIESVKAASDIYAPMSGEIIEINENLEDEPELVNQSPEVDGWIAKVQIADMSEKSALMDADKYEDYLKTLQ